MLRTQPNKVTTRYSENSQHHTAPPSPPASFQEDLSLEETHSAETAVIVDNNLLIPWHTFGSSLSTALLQAVAELACCDADAESQSSCLYS